MDYDLIVIKILERISKNYYYIIRGENVVFIKTNLEKERNKNDKSIIRMSWYYMAKSAKAFISQGFHDLEKHK